MKLSMDNIKSSKAYENGFSMIQYAQMDFTGKCNANCKGCCGWRNHNGKEIPFDKAKELIDAIVGGMNIKNVFVCCQAEFSLYSHCIDLINYVNDNYKDVILRQDTNGILIPDGFIETINNLSNNKYDLSVSLWGGNREEYLKYHGVDNYDKVINNARRYLREITNPNVVFRFSTVYWNKEQYEGALNLIKELATEVGKEVIELETMSITDVIDHSNDKGKIVVYKRCSYYPEIVPDDFTDETYGIIREKVTIDENGNEIKYKEQMLTKDWNGFRKPVPADNNCFLLNRNLCIRVDGGVAGCLGALDYHENDLGNIFDQPVTKEWFMEILNSDKRKKSQLLNATKGAFPCCHKCISRICY